MEFPLLRIPSIVVLCSLLVSCETVSEIARNLGELCRHENFVVVTEEVGNDPNALCARSTGECQSLREGINTAQLCAASAPKVVQLVPNGTYTIREINQAAPSAGSRVRQVKLKAGPSGLPAIYSDIRIVGDATTIQRDIDSAQGFRLITVTQNGNLTLESVVLKNGYSAYAPGRDELSYGAPGDWFTGGAIYNRGTVNIYNVSFQNNRTITFSDLNSIEPERVDWVNYTRGGAIFNRGTLRIDNQSAFSDNYSNVGSAIYNDGQESEAFASVRDTVFTANNPDTTNYRHYDQIHNNRGSMEIVGSTLKNIRKEIGVSNHYGSMVIDSCTAFDNIGSGPTHIAGFVWTAGRGARSEIKRSTFSNIEAYGSVIMVNVPEHYDIRDGEERHQNNTVLQDLTIVNNSVNTAALIYRKDGGNRSSGLARISLSNSIIADNLPADCELPASESISITADGGLDSDGSCDVMLTDANVELGPLRDNGGFTLTHMPNPGSPVIDAGGSICLGRDQRGRTRPRGVGFDGFPECDIGAVEVHPPIFRPPVEPIDPISPIEPISP